MDFFRSIKFKSNIDFFYDCAEYISEDSTFNIDDSVYMCWTNDNEQFNLIHNFIDKLKNKLNCEISRSCYTVQRSKKSNLPIHIDKDDSIMDRSIHGEIYSLIIPIKGSGITKFYNLHSEDNGPNNTDIHERYNLYIGNTNIEQQVQMHSAVTIEQPTILNISQPHSVTVVTAPRITYHLKLLQVSEPIDKIAEILSEI